MEPSKNIASLICEKGNTLLNRLCNSILFISSFKIMRKFLITEEQITTILLPCFRLLIGGGEPFRIVYANELKLAFIHIRLIIVKNRVFQRIRGILTMRSDSLVNNNESDESHMIKRPLSGCISDQLLSICLFIVSSDTINTTKTTPGTRTESGINNKQIFSDSLIAFSSEILTVPMVTLLLSEEGT